MMDIQVFSDIHLEFYNDFPKIDRKADVLFLAGDIGKLYNKIFNFIYSFSLRYRKRSIKVDDKLCNYIIFAYNMSNKFRKV